MAYVVKVNGNVMAWAVPPNATAQSAAIALLEANHAKHARVGDSLTFLLEIWNGATQISSVQHQCPVKTAANAVNATKA